MKYDNLRGLQKHLQACRNGHFSFCYFVLSEDEFEKERAKKMILSAILETQTKAPSQVYFKAGEIKPYALTEELFSQSLFSDKKIVVIDDSDKISKQDLETLLPFLEKGSKNHYLIFLTSNLKKENKLYKSSEKYGVVLDLPQEKPWQKEKSLAVWLIEIGESLQKVLGQEAIKLLISSVGSDKALLHSELLKLAAYVGDRPEIRVEDISAISFAIPNDSAWQLGEAIFQRKPSLAHQITANLLKSGAAPLQILRQVRSQFQTDFQVACLLAKGAPKEEISRSFPYMKGFILDQHVKAASYGTDSFKKGLLLIDALEFDLRNASLDPEFALEKLILNLCIR